MAIKYLTIIGIPQILKKKKKLIQGVIAGTGHTKILMISIFIANFVELFTLLILKNINMDSIVIIGFSALFWLITDFTICTAYFLSKKWKKI